MRFKSFVQTCLGTNARPPSMFDAQTFTWPLRKDAQHMMSTIGIQGVRINRREFCLTRVLDRSITNYR